MLSMLRAVGAEPIETPHGSLEAIFDSEYVGVGFEAEIESYSPRLTARSIDVQRLGITHGSTVTRCGVTYIVRGTQPDGNGETIVVLEAP